MELPPKKDVMLALLERSSVFIHLNPRHENVRVPSWFKKQPQLVLQVGLNMPVPIRDLHVDDECVSCTLSFSRTPHFCYLPWTAVYALVSEEGGGMVWPDDIPPEVVAQAANRRVAGHDDKQGKAKPAKGKQRRLRSVPAGGGEAVEKPPIDEAPPADAVEAPHTDEPAQQKVDEPAASMDEKGKRPLPPYLRVVK